MCLYPKLVCGLKKSRLKEELTIGNTARSKGIFKWTWVDWAGEVWERRKWVSAETGSALAFLGYDLPPTCGKVIHLAQPDSFIPPTNRNIFISLLLEWWRHIALVDVFIHSWVLCMRYIEYSLIQVYYS